MAVFDPNDWWDRSSWLRPAAEDRRKPAEINREVVVRWLASAALCLCFALVASSARLELAFAGLMIASAVASATLALLRGEAFHSPHLTHWDEAVLSLAAGLALVVWNASSLAGAP